MSLIKKRHIKNHNGYILIDETFLLNVKYHETRKQWTQTTKTSKKSIDEVMTINKVKNKKSSFPSWRFLICHWHNKIFYHCFIIQYEVMTNTSAYTRNGGAKSNQITNINPQVYCLGKVSYNTFLLPLFIPLFWHTHAHIKSKWVQK